MSFLSTTNDVPGLVCACTCSYLQVNETVWNILISRSLSEGLVD